MAALSDYAENAVGNLLLRGVALTAPATVYLALFTAAPGEAGSTNEVTGGSYARKAITFGAPTNGAFSNNARIYFDDMPAVTVTHWAIYDATTAGNMLYHGAWGTARSYTAGDTATVLTGQLTITHN